MTTKNPPSLRTPGANTPVRYEDSKPYWNGVENQELWAQQCAKCERFSFPPRTRCGSCLGSLEWKRCSGHGAIYSFSVIERPPQKEFAADVPYVVALIELEEGFHMFSRVINVTQTDDLTIGQPVTIDFHAIGSYHLPVFTLA